MLFVDSAADDDDLAAFSAIPAVEVVKHASLGGRRWRLMNALLTGIDRVTAAVFREYGIDVVFEHARFFGWRLPLPVVAWFPDLQHRRLPHLFSKRAWWQRELGFRTQLAAGRYLILSSNSALSDCKVFYPGFTNRASVVRFASLPTDDLIAVDPRDVIAQYNLPNEYLYLPNQFWRHKNHQLVLDALSILIAEGVEVVVVASGAPDVPPHQFNEIMRQVESRDLSSSFRYLGLIPPEHVYALLRATRSLINPSRFEGWSTTVEEAKSFGVPMIISDLDVHREQAHDLASYFNVDDAAALARLIAQTISAPSLFEVRDVASGAEERVAKFAGDFVCAISSACANKSNES